MKRSIFMIFVLLLTFCGCQKNEITVESFSYADTLNYYGEATVGIKRDGFVNTERTEITSVEQAIELAKKECTVKYNEISAAYDNQEKIYHVMFSTKNMLGGDQNVYLTSEGVTVLIIYGE